MCVDMLKCSNVVFYSLRFDLVNECMEWKEMLNFELNQINPSRTEKKRFRSRKFKNAPS